MGRNRPSRSPGNMRRRTMASGAMRLNQTRVGSLGAVQRARHTQGGRTNDANQGNNQDQSKCPNARSLHPVNILSTMDLVRCICLGGRRTCSILAVPGLAVGFSRGWNLLYWTLRPPFVTLITVEFNG